MFTPVTRTVRFVPPRGYHTSTRTESPLHTGKPRARPADVVVPSNQAPLRPTPIVALEPGIPDPSSKSRRTAKELAAKVAPEYPAWVPKDVGPARWKMRDIESPGRLLGSVLTALQLNMKEARKPSTLTGMPIKAAPDDAVGVAGLESQSWSNEFAEGSAFTDPCIFQVTATPVDVEGSGIFHIFSFATGSMSW